MQGLGSVVGRGDLIRKISIPRWIIVVSSSIGALINLGLNLIVIAIFTALNHVSISSSIFLIPIPFIEAYTFGLGLSLFLSAAFVKYRDVSYIWEVVLQAGFYATPILYPLSRITNITVQKLILLNPMAQAIQNARYDLVTHQTITTHKIFHGGWHAFIPYVVVLVVLIGGAAYYRNQSRFFAENI